MSFFEKLAATFIPPESDEDRRRARHAALALAGDEDWLATAIAHHSEIEALFDATAAAALPQERTDALTRLGRHLNAHSMAEEVVLYPAIADFGNESWASEAYEQQAMAKIEMARLEQIDPASATWRDKLEEIRDAVLHHIYEEESGWFADLQRATDIADRQRLTARFQEEYNRHSDVCEDAGGLARTPGDHSGPPSATGLTDR